MKFWDLIYDYQIEANIEREYLKRQIAIDEFKYVVAKELGVIKVTKWLTDIINKIIW